MNKKIFTLGLLLVVLSLTGCNNQASTQNAEAKKTAPANQQDDLKKTSNVDKIEVVYFYGSRRCFSCQTIEKYAKETVEEYFQKEIENGKITFESVNVELPQNRDITNKYKSRGSSIFINIIRDEKDNIAEDVAVWRLVNNEQKFKEYLKNKIETILH